MPTRVNLWQKNLRSAFLQPQFSKSIKTHLFSIIFNQNRTIFHQNHTKTTPLFNTFRQNFPLFAFSRQRVFAKTSAFPQPIKPAVSHLAGTT